MLMKNITRIGNIRQVLTKFSKFSFSTKNYIKTNLYTINYKYSKSSFSTNNKIDEKNAIEFIESGVFEVLKSAAKCKHDKLNRSATLEELGKPILNKLNLLTYQVLIV